MKLVQVKKSSSVHVLHQTRTKLSPYTHCHFDFGQHHSHNLENMTCDCGHYIALLGVLLMILGGLHAFHLGRWSSQLDVLAQENKTLNDDDFENQKGNEEKENEILNETEIVLKHIRYRPKKYFKKKGKIRKEKKIGIAYHTQDKLKQTPQK